MKQQPLNGTEYTEKSQNNKKVHFDPAESLTPYKDTRYKFKTKNKPSIKKNVVHKNNQVLYEDNKKLINKIINNSVRLLGFIQNIDLQDNTQRLNEITKFIQKFIDELHEYDNLKYWEDESFNKSIESLVRKHQEGYDNIILQLSELDNKVIKEGLGVIERDLVNVTYNLIEIEDDGYTKEKVGDLLYTLYCEEKEALKGKVEDAIDKVKNFTNGLNRHCNKDDIQQIIDLQKLLTNCIYDFDLLDNRIQQNIKDQNEKRFMDQELKRELVIFAYYANDLPYIEIVQPYFLLLQKIYLLEKDGAISDKSLINNITKNITDKLLQNHRKELKAMMMYFKKFSIDDFSTKFTQFFIDTAKTSIDQSKINFCKYNISNEEALRDVMSKSNIGEFEQELIKSQQSKALDEVSVNAAIYGTQPLIISPNTVKDHNTAITQANTNIIERMYLWIAQSFKKILSKFFSVNDPLHHITLKSTQITTNDINKVATNVEQQIVNTQPNCHDKLKSDGEDKIDALLIKIVNEQLSQLDENKLSTSTIQLQTQPVIKDEHQKTHIQIIGQSRKPDQDGVSQFII